jgi:hypothetical protein
MFKLPVFLLALALVSHLISYFVAAAEIVAVYLGVAGVFMLVLCLVAKFLYTPKATSVNMPLVGIIGRNWLFGGGYWIYTRKTVYSKLPYAIIFEDGSSVDTNFGLLTTDRGERPMTILNELGIVVYPK